MADHLITTEPLSAAEVVKRYHQRTKHQLQRFAAGPDTLDWDAQPNPFRHWAGAPVSRLPLLAAMHTASWQDVCAGAVPAAPLNRASVALLLELCFGLTAWKQFGPDRWSLRANPSSGNLHPTEAYVLTQAVDGLPDGLYHYAPDDHALAQRAARPVVAGKAGDVPASLHLGLSSVNWREAWKYGERAFRYSQLDAGHALGAVRFAAAVLGWQALRVPGLGHAQLAAAMGLDRDADFGRAEREEPEMLIALRPRHVAGDAMAPPEWPADTVWHGQANRLDAHPMYRWPVIDEVAQATRAQAAPTAGTSDVRAPCGDPPPATRPAWWPSLGLAPRDTDPASRLIRERRSAQHFDRRATMPMASFQRLLAALMPAAGLPWDSWPLAPRVHLVVYAHRVEGVPAGAYVLPRSEAGLALLQAQGIGKVSLSPAPGWPVAVPLHSLAEHPTLSGTLRTLSCHQAIASDACVAFSLVADFGGPVQAQPAAYREALQEAGLIGQVLYLQAEAEGLHGTGIGCYFDDAVHELLGLQGDAMQVLYHFTVGQAQTDERISTEPPYTADRQLIDTPLTAALAEPGV
jgi:SagB-type dehydrogenase family enzyme